MLSNIFQPRIGSLATPTTRIFYILSVNGQQALSYYDPAPANASIESEFYQLGSDLRVYPYNSIAKAVLSSLYIQMYPFTPSNRGTLENQIMLALQILSVVNLNQQVNVLYDELYYGQSTQKYVSRVYYSVNNSLHFFLLI